MAAPTYRGVSAANCSGTTSAVFTRPSGTVQGDLCFIIFESTDSTTTAGTPNVPSGWDQIYQETFNSGNSSEPAVLTTTVFAQICPETTPASVTVDGVGNHISGRMLSVTVGTFGVANVLTDIVVGAASNHGTGTTDLVTANAITVTAASLILWIIGLSDDAADTSNASGYTNANFASITERWDDTVSTGAGGGVAVATATCAGTTTGTAGNWDHDTAAASMSVYIGIPPMPSPIWSMGQHIEIENTTDATSFTSAAFTPATSVLALVACVSGIAAAGGQNRPTLSTTMSGITIQEEGWTYWDQSDNGSQLTWWLVDTGSAPGASKTFTFDFSGQTQTSCLGVWFEYTHPSLVINTANLAAHIVQQKQGTEAATPSQTGSITLDDAPDSLNMVVGMVANTGTAFNMAYGKLFAGAPATGGGSRIHSATPNRSAMMQHDIALATTTVDWDNAIGSTETALWSCWALELAPIAQTVNVDITTTTVAQAATIPTPTVTATAAITPSTIASTAAVPTAAVTATASVTTATIAVAATIPTPGVVASSPNASVTPDTVARIATIPTPSVVATAALTSTTIAATASIPTPSVVATAAITTSTVAATSTIPTPGIVGTASITPATVNAVIVVPTPTVAATAALTTATVVATATIPSPSVSASAAVVPNTITALVSIPALGVVANAEVQLNVIEIVSTIPVPGVIGTGGIVAGGFMIIGPVGV